MEVLRRPLLRLVGPLLSGRGRRGKGKALQPFNRKASGVCEAFHAGAPGHIKDVMVPMLVAAALAVEIEG